MDTNMKIKSDMKMEEHSYQFTSNALGIFISLCPYEAGGQTRRKYALPSLNGKSSPSLSSP
jgi:hypothetical protein